MRKKTRHEPGGGNFAGSGGGGGGGDEDEIDGIEEPGNLFLPFSLSLPAETFN